jgi:hypothetical protein
MKRKRKIFQTAEERAAWETRIDNRLRELRAHIARITEEIASRRRPA